MRKLNKGFTLVELLVVIAIIGILASVVLVSLNSARGKARDARRTADLHQISLALENYYDASGAYPTNLAALVTGGYLTVEPKDPQSSASYTYNADNCTPADQKYVIKAVLENHVSALDSDVDGDQCAQVGLCGAQGANEREYCIMP